MSEQADAIERVRAHIDCDGEVDRSDVASLLAAYDAQTAAIGEVGQTFVAAIVELDSGSAAKDHRDRRLHVQGGASRLRFALETMRVAFGLPGEWPDGDES